MLTHSLSHLSNTSEPINIKSLGCGKQARSHSPPSHTLTTQGQNQECVWMWGAFRGYGDTPLNSEWGFWCQIDLPPAGDWSTQDTGERLYVLSVASPSEELILHWVGWGSCFSGLPCSRGLVQHLGLMPGVEWPKRTGGFLLSAGHQVARAVDWWVVHRDEWAALGARRAQPSPASHQCQCDSGTSWLWAHMALQAPSQTFLTDLFLLDQPESVPATYREPPDWQAECVWWPWGCVWLIPRTQTRGTLNLLVNTKESELKTGGHA